MNRFSMPLAIVLLLIAGSVGQAADWKPAQAPIMTKWADQVDPESPLPEYPRPIMVREDWMNLNGIWEFEPLNAHDSATFGRELRENILVPFPVESALSGIKRHHHHMQYRRTFDVPGNWADKRIILHFGAVDYESEVYINAQCVGVHKGGYDPFSYDITPYLVDGKQELVVRVFDPTEAAGQPRGKQVTTPEGIMYTPSSGIWQTVWLEPVNEVSIKKLQIVPDIDRQQVKVAVNTTLDASSFTANIKVLDDGKVVSELSGKPNTELGIYIDNCKLWSPDDPFLYDLDISLTRDDVVYDQVDSYFGMRKIEIKKVDGITRMLLNNEFVFQYGPLDQGFWPDGLYTPPTEEAIKYDLEFTKAFGFNMVRKHIKVEPARWYYWTDKLGLLVWQDMPSANSYTTAQSLPVPAVDKEQYTLELKRMIDNLYNHPSIIMWVVFNEAQGKHDTERLVNLVRQLDSSRLVNNDSGVPGTVGDVSDVHIYPGPGMPPLEDNRAAVLGEFGGLGLPVEGHMWTDKGNWGYRTYFDVETLEREYTKLMSQLWPMVDRGLCAAVYTQTSDVEIEVNGLVTYDRKVVKLDPAKFIALNNGYLPPHFTTDQFVFVDDFYVEVKAPEEDVDVRYTVDGSTPTANSPLYTSPIRIDETTTVKVRSYYKDGTASIVLSEKFERTAPLKPVRRTGLRKGLEYESYVGNWQNLPDFDELGSPVASGTVSVPNLSNAVRDSQHGMRFTGYIRAPKSGLYKFNLVSDDGSRLLINDRIVVNHDGIHGMVPANGYIPLRAGLHPFEVQFFQGNGDQGLRVNWQVPGDRMKRIEADSFAH